MVFAHRNGRSWITTYTLYATHGERWDLDGRKSSCSSVRLFDLTLYSSYLLLPTSVYFIYSLVLCLWCFLHLSAGYQCEVDALLRVNRQSRLSRDQEHLNKAAELLKQLLDQTSLFLSDTGHQSRYLYVMVHTQSPSSDLKVSLKKWPSLASTHFKSLCKFYGNAILTTVTALKEERKLCTTWIRVHLRLQSVSFVSY